MSGQDPGTGHSFRVILTEVRQRGVPQEELAGGLGRLLGIPPESAAQYIDNIPCNIAVGASGDAAQRLQRGLEQVGLGCRLEPEGDTQQRAPSQASPQPSASLELDDPRPAPGRSGVRAGMSGVIDHGGRFSSSAGFSGGAPPPRRAHTAEKRTTLDLSALVKVAVLAAIGAVAIYLYDPRISVQTEHGSRTFTYRTRLMSEGPPTGRPIIFALHGDGDTPRHFDESLFGDLKLDARLVLIKGPSPFSSGKLFSSAWPTVSREVVSVGDAVDAVAIELAEEYESPCQPIVLGFSGGARIAFYLAANHPTRYSSVLALSGQLTHDAMPERGIELRRAPYTWAAQGVHDQVTNTRVVRETVAELIARRVPVQLHLFEGGHLDFFTEQRPTVHGQLVQAVERCGNFPR